MIEPQFRERIFQSVIALHKWREGYNGDSVGAGHDQYKPNDMFHYPEAYALWGEGYLKLFNITSQKEFLNLTEKCAEWLIENRNPVYKNFSWGLPWDWEARKAPKELSYLITTVLVGDFLLSIYNTAHMKQFLDVAESIAKWILEENGAVSEGDRIWFYYANHPSFKFPVINVISKASAFFAKLYSCTQDTYYKGLAIKSAEYVMDKGNENGSWYYDDNKTCIDNVHTGFTIEGLCDVYMTFPFLTKILNCLMSAHEFYWNELYTPSGFGKERTAGIRAFRKLSKILIAKYVIFPHSILETRLYGYGAGIRAFTKLSKILAIENKGLTIAKYVIENLKSENGAFKFRSNENKYYIRQEAHIFDALASLLVS
ncbi:MAG: hypothetical protein QXH91_05935 [Candidatus Bathyarchaeia archaeon]